VLSFSDPVSLRRQVTEIDNICAAIDWASETGHELLGALSVARNTAAMNATGAGHRYLDLLRLPFPEATRSESATLLLMRVNLATQGFIGFEALGHPDQRALELFNRGHLDDDLAMALAMSLLVAPDVTSESTRPILKAAARLSPPVASAVALTLATLLIREDRLEEAIEADRQSLERCPQSRQGAHGGFELALLLALTGQHDQARSVADNLQPVPGSFVYGPTLAAAASQIGTDSAEHAATQLAHRARAEVTGRIVGQEGEYLMLFAAFRHDIGDDQRATELLDGLQGRNSTISRPSSTSWSGAGPGANGSNECARPHNAPPTCRKPNDASL